MDNASNCNTLAALLPNYIETFHGPERRLRCIAHILNLVAKVSETLNMMLSRVNLIVWIFFQVFLSFFFKKRSKRKLPAVAVADNTDIVIAPSADDNDVLDLDTATAEELDHDDDVLADDDGHVVFNTAAVMSLLERAIGEMRDDNITFTAQEEREASQILPKVCHYFYLINYLLTPHIGVWTCSSCS